MNRNDCIFCKILKGEIPAKPVYEDDQVIAINDIDPKAPTHILVLPRAHIETLNDVTDSNIVGHMISVATQLAKKNGHDMAGYRVVMNCNEEGGQSVPHIHAHLLAGRKMTWPPG
jgi:histidine triad (HIT) family protein